MNLHWHKKSQWSELKWQEMIVIGTGERTGYRYQSRVCSVCHKLWQRTVS